MRNYIIRRLLWAIPLTFGVLTLVFLLVRVMPGDIALVMLSEENATVDPIQLATLREELGLNVPLWEQYFNYLSDLAHFDLGNSMWSNKPVWSEISIRLPYTLSIMLLAIIISIIVSIPFGVLAALKRDTWIDYFLRGVVVIGTSAPSFWVGLLILMFTLKVMNWSPPIQYAPIFVAPLIAIQQLFLPALVLGYRSAADNVRMIRSSMLETLNEDFVRTARSKGLTERTVTYIHALKPAMLPGITLLGMDLVHFVGGAVIIETIFNIPGIGRLLVESVIRHDYTLVQGIVTFKVLLVVVINLGVDLIYAVTDPRVRYK